MAGIFFKTADLIHVDFVNKGENSNASNYIINDKGHYSRIKR